MRKIMYQAALEQTEQNHRHRTRLIRNTSITPFAHVDGQEYLCFNHFDYLGLSQHPEVMAAFKKGAEQYGVGSGGSPHVIGYTQAHHKLEETFAALTGMPRALFFSSGFHANLSILSALTQKNTLLFEDRRNHASLIDGARLNGASVKRFKHRDKNHLTALANAQSPDFIVSDAVFSVDGAIAELPELIEIKQKFNASLILDDAHGFGVLGAHGLGTVEHYGQNIKDVDLLLVPCGKALGGMGAIVAGSELFIENVLQFGRSYLFSTAMPPAMASALTASLNILQCQPELRAQLHANIHNFKIMSAQAGLNVLSSDTAIHNILIGEEAHALRAMQKIKDKNILVSLFRTPTVPVNQASLRVNLTALHEKNHIEQLVGVLKEVLS